jgi:transposase-like protein
MARKYPKLCAWVEENIEETLTFYRLPREHHKHLKSTNMRESSKAEAVLLKARALHPEDASIAFNLACYASVTGRMEEAKVRLRQAIDLDKDIRLVALDDEDLRPLWDWIGGLK